ncbi:MAG: hypothetical protein ACLT0Y_06915 [Christensenellales bacterium]
MRIGNLDITFDAIYTGYLGSDKQVALIEQLFDLFGSEQRCWWWTR